MAAAQTHGESPTVPPQPLDRDAAENIARTLRAMADPTRLQLLSMMYGTQGAKIRVWELADALGLRAPTVSHHLRIMVEDGLLLREQDGRNAWFTIAPERLEAIGDLLR